MPEETDVLPDSKGRDDTDLQTLARVTVNLVRPAQVGLKELMEHTGLSKTDVINRALQLYADLQREMDAGGGVYVRPNGSRELERLRIY
jgi:hypothetical protein